MPTEQAATRTPDPQEPAAARLRRWELAGGTWQVAAQAGSTVTIALCRCDGGEEVERFTSSDPALLAQLGGRTSSEA